MSDAATVALPVRHAGFIRLSGLAGIVGGILLIVVAVIAWFAVSSQLRAENIVAVVSRGRVISGELPR